MSKNNSKLAPILGYGENQHEEKYDPFDREEEIQVPKLEEEEVQVPELKEERLDIYREKFLRTGELSLLRQFPQEEIKYANL